MESLEHSYHYHVIFNTSFWELSWLNAHGISGLF